MPIDGPGVLNLEAKSQDDSWGVGQQGPKGTPGIVLLNPAIFG